MRRRLAAVALGVALAGCASTGWPFDSANMLLARAPDGREVVKVSDFGLAKSYLSAGASLLTRMGEARGTPLFMAPEQFLNYRFVGPSVDVYAVGVTLYCLLTGSALFDASAARAAGQEVFGF